MTASQIVDRLLEDDKDPKEDILHAAEQGRIPGRRRIAIAYEIVTPESAEQGDVAERGWEDEEGISMEPDAGEIEDDISAVDKAARYLEDAAACYTDQTWHSHGWYETRESDMYDGSETTRHFFLKGFTEAEELQVFNEFSRLGKRFQR